MTAALTPPPKIQFFANDGTPLVGGKLYSYAAGTTTPLATYTTYAGTVANTNPVILDSRGEADVWLGANFYKLALYDADNALIWTVDNITNSGNLLQAELAAAGGSALIGYLPSGTGAVARTVQAKLRESVSVGDFGAVGNGVADDTAAIQNAINSLTDGGVVNFPLGLYRTTSTITIQVRGITLQGQLQTTTNADEGDCRIVVDHDLGAGIRIKAYNSTIDTLIVSGSASRISAGTTGTNGQPNFGIWIEADDVSGGAGYIQRIKLRDVTVRNQPNSGVVSIGENSGSEFYSVASLYNGGHGFVFSNGYYTSRANLSPPGIVQFTNCRVTDCGGHALAVGSPFDTGLSAYRFSIENFEAVRVCTNVSILYDTSAIFLAGQNQILNLSAAGGSTYRFATVSGRNIQVNNCRLFGLSPAINVVERAGGAEPTRGVYVVAPSLFPTAGTKFNPVVSVATDCQEVSVDIASDQRGSQTTYITAINENFQGYYKKDSNDISAGFPIESESFASTPTITLLNDTVYAYEFLSTTSYGVLVFHGFSDSAVYGLCVFRSSGTGLFVQSINVGSEVNTTTGPLTGTTGVAGKFTVSVDATKLYFENRRGGSRSFKVTFLSGDFEKKYV